MKTGDLVRLLAQDLEPVDRGAHRRQLALALTAASVLAVVLTLAFLGTRQQAFSEADLPFFYVREAFCAVSSLGSVLLAFRLSTPGRKAGSAVRFGLILPLACLALLAGHAVYVAEPALRMPMLLGHTWRVCSVLIAGLSLPYLRAFLWIMKLRAPTRLRAAGAAAGAASGTLAALTYTLHCPEVSPAFLAVWYVLGMLAPVALGAALGPKLLRW